MATLKTANGKSKYFDNHSRYDDSASRQNTGQALRKQSL